MTAAGVVSAIHRYPVKSMLGEPLQSAALTARGVAGDRSFALIDAETGKVVSVKRPKRWGRIFELSATTHPEGADVVFPDGSRLSTSDPELADRLSEFFGRRVAVATTPSIGATFDEAWVRELKNGAEPYFGLESRTEDDEADLIDAGQFMGMQGNFFNFGAVHLVTTGTTRRLGELSPESRFDPLRFRPNIVVETDENDFVETDWQGKTLTIGDVRLAVSFTVPRCVMTTLQQGDLPADTNVLRTIAEHNAVDCFSTGVRYPCVGVYADVVVEGEIAVGQPVTIE